MEETEQNKLLMDLEVVMKSNDCPYIVQFYGAIFKEVRDEADSRSYVTYHVMLHC